MQTLEVKRRASSQNPEISRSGGVWILHSTLSNSAINILPRHSDSRRSTDMCDRAIAVIKIDRNVEAVNSTVFRGRAIGAHENDETVKSTPRLLFPWDLLYDTAKATNRRARRGPSTASMCLVVPRKAYIRFRCGEQKGHVREPREIGVADGPEPFAEYKLRSGPTFFARSLR